MRCSLTSRLDAHVAQASRSPGNDCGKIPVPREEARAALRHGPIMKSGGCGYGAPAAGIA